MDPLWQTVAILTTGLVVVVGGILALRLHAFLALLFGSLAVAALTPARTVEWNAVLKEAVTCRSIESLSDSGPPGSRLWKVTAADSRKPDTVKADTRYLIIPGGFALNQPVRSLGRLITLPVGQQTEKAFRLARLQPAEDRAGDPVVEIPVGSLLIEPHRLSAAQKAAGQSFASRVAAGFGSTAGSIGILIAMASIIGKCLLDSGAADRIVRTSLQLFGERMAPAAFVWTGFLLGIPVFFDTVFYLLVPLGKAMHVRTGRNYLLYVLTIVCGATMAHSLVPPTPGPLIAAEQLGVDLGLMMLGGCLVGSITAASGFAFASFLNRRCTLPLRETADCSLADLEQLSQRRDEELPSFPMAVLPILLPVLFIGGVTIIDSLQLPLPAAVLQTLKVLGDKNIAITLAAALSMLTLIRTRHISRQQLTDAVSQSLTSGGGIILITSAGGAFGQVLQETGIAHLITSLPVGSPVIMISTAWLITLAVRVAQGSATVAMVTAGGVLAGIATSGQITFHPLYLALAIGCGSKPATWMNDSGFWVITKMSGMTEAEGLKYVSTMNSVMGLAGLIVTIIGALAFPLTSL